MGSRCYLKFEKFSLFISKSVVLPEVMLIFRESDRKVYRTREDGQWFTKYEYSHNARVLKERLELMGYTIANVKKKLEVGKKKAIAEMEEITREDGTTFYKEHLDVLKKSDFSDWINAYKYIRENNLYSTIGYGDMTKPSTPKLVKYLLENDDYGYFFNFPDSDVYDVLRMFLESCSDNMVIAMDVTELIEGGYYSPEQELCNEALDQLKQNHPLNEKITILTEGSSDKNILEQSLQLLYPHLCEYYSFTNFEISNSAGGANQLVSTIKSFVGSGITNRVIAIFDNDTAGESAIRTLSKTKIPKNIKIMKYPDIEVANNYPTIGPSGVQMLNINGLACSLEVYLGQDVLKKGSGLTPVQWKGYEAGLAKYQGEITEKNIIQEKFYRKIKKCRTNKRLYNEKNWRELRIIFQTIFKAYQ